MLKIIFNHLKSEWYKYVIEVIVVILGILIAYNLEQWSDTRSNKKREIEILKEFKGALGADLAEMQNNIIRGVPVCRYVRCISLNWCSRHVNN